MFEEEIKAELKKRGLDPNLHTEIKVTKKEEIETAVYDFKVAQDVKKGIEASKDSIVTEAIKAREATIRAELKTELEEEFKAKMNEELEKLKKKPDPDKTPSSSEELVNTAVDKVLEAMKPFQDTVKGLQEADKENSRKAVVLAELKSAELSEDWATTITATEPEEIKAQIKARKDLLDKSNQDAIDKKLDDLNVPDHKKVGASGSQDSLIKEMADKKNKASVEKDPDFKGKKDLIPTQ